MPDHHCALLRLAYMGGPVDVRIIVRAALENLCGDVRVKQWRRMPPGAITKMIGVAIDEHTKPAMRLCRRCRGKGTIYPPNSVPVVCDKCAGHKVRRPSGAILARALGVTRSGWVEVWASRYSVVYALVDGWMDEALMHVARGLSEDMV